MNYNNIFASIRKQKAFTAFMTTLVVVGSFSAAFAARNASALSADSVLLNVTDTLSTSKPDAFASHTIKFSLKTPISGSLVHPIEITFASGTIPAFTFSDVSVAGSGAYVGQAACDATVGAYTVSVSSQTVNVLPCTNTTFATTTPVTIVLGTAATKIQNPDTVGSYQIEIFHDSGTVQQGQTIRYMILSDVHMSAVVDPIFTFFVTGTTTAVSVNGSATTTVTTAADDTKINFGTLIPGKYEVAAQDLKISTNARNGFNVTARTDSEFVSANGATIDPFNYTVSTSTPTAWIDPLGTLNNDRTWGNIGLTTSDITNTAVTGQNLWIGNFIQNPVTVFSQASSTRNQIETVGFKVQITDLQEAATDYQTNVVYVATPVF